MQTPKLHLDFETRSKIEIKRSGAWRYAIDESTSITCLAYALNDGPIEILSREDIYQNSEKLKIFWDLVNWVLFNHGYFCAHNSLFELSIWQNHMVPLGLPVIPINRWSCSASRAATCSLPRGLDAVGEALGLTHKKDRAGYRLMLKMCKPRKPTEKNPAEWNEDPEDFIALGKYCIDDVAAERELDAKLPELTAFERRVWELDQKINIRGVLLDRDLYLSAIKVFEDYGNTLKAKTYQLTRGSLAGTSRTAALKEWFSVYEALELDNLQKATIEKILKDGELSSVAKALLEIRQQLSKSSISKFTAMLYAVDSESVIRDIFMYYGATPTGRWTGKNMQMHNLPKGNLKDQEAAIEFIKNQDFNILELLFSDVAGVLSSCIRGAIIARPGKKLIVADYASIEARILAWLSGNIRVVKLYQEGADLYLDLAQKIYKNPALLKTNKKERELGKSGFLGCGYGCGAPKFKDMCDKKALDLELSLAKLVVDTYRTENPQVPVLWKALEKAAVLAVRNPGKEFPVGLVTWVMRGPTLLCKLPSGRNMVYMSPQVKMVETEYGDRTQLSFMGVDSTTKKWRREKTWGGVLTGHIVQGLARDLMAHAMLNAEQKGYTVLFTVHDEVIAEVPDLPRYTVAEFEQILCDLPTWAGNCPITAEGWEGKRYKK